MAQATEIKEYLACWMQLGRRLILSDRAVSLDQVIAGDHYTTRFEEIWQEGQSHPESTSLEGSSLTLKELLAPSYELLSCPRCNLPLPSASLGPRSAQPCPCDNLNLWPNFDTVPPRQPVDTTAKLRSICHRLAEN